MGGRVLAGQSFDAIVYYKLQSCYSYYILILELYLNAGDLGAVSECGRFGSYIRVREIWNTPLTVCYMGGRMFVSFFRLR